MSESTFAGKTVRHIVRGSMCAPKVVFMSGYNPGSPATYFGIGTIKCKEHLHVRRFRHQILLDSKLALGVNMCSLSGLLLRWPWYHTLGSGARHQRPAPEPDVPYQTPGSDTKPQGPVPDLKICHQIPGSGPALKAQDPVPEPRFWTP